MWNNTLVDGAEGKSGFPATTVPVCPELAETPNLWCPVFRPYVEAVLSEGHVGTYRGCIGLESSRASCPAHEAPLLGHDIFAVIIPYTGVHLTWTFLFDLRVPDFAPDMLFCDATFCPELDTLSPWEPARRDMLVVWVGELLDQFGDHQLRRINSHETLAFEYNMLVQQAELGLTHDDIQVRLVEDGAAMVEARFLVQLRLDMSELPAHMLRTGSDGQLPSAHLLTTYQGGACASVTPEILFNPAAREIFSAKTINFPTFPVGACLADYVGLVLDTVKAEVTALRDDYLKRIYMVEALNHALRGALLEFDSAAYTYASYLISKDDFRCVVHLFFGGKFPSERPKVLFQSVYHQANVGGTPYEETMSRFDWNSRWTGKEMANRFKAALPDLVATFRSSSVRNGSIFGVIKDR